MNRAGLAHLLLAAIILYVIGFYFVGSAIKPNYSQLSNFISEYNATGTAHARILTYAGYVGISTMLVAFLLVARPILQVSDASRVGFWLAFAIPGSYLLSAIAPCDPGCPLDGSPSQQLHNILGVVTYFGMGVSTALLGLAPGFSGHPARRAFLWTTGIAFPVVFVLMLQPEVAPIRGLLQRLLDVALAISLVLVLRTLTPAGRSDRLPRAGAGA